MDNIVQTLNQRREYLGISQPQLAAMTDVSLPTIQRFFSDKGANVSYETVSKIAHVLGIALTSKPIMDEHKLLEQRAREKAHALAAIVQGTSSLEAQGLPKHSLQGIEQKIFYELMSGSRRKLWSA